MKMAKNKKFVRKTYHKGKASHKRLDDKMVTAVMVAAGISVLILLASYISVTGLAVSGTPDTEGMTTIFQNAELIEGSGRFKCSTYCGRLGMYAGISTLDQELVDNDYLGNGDYTCLCFST